MGNLIFISKIINVVSQCRNYFDSVDRSSSSKRP